MRERVVFTTADGVEIVGDWYAAPNPSSFALLLHMRPATKESWKPWAERLVARGTACLAIDQRGHGESTMGGALDYQAFGDEESRGKRFDVEAALAWLRSRGAIDATTRLWGASIGANLAIRAAADHEKIPFVIALSPGRNFRGVTTDDVVPKLREHQRVLLVASDDDPHGSFDDARALHTLNPSHTTLIERQGIGHGTTMLERDPALFDAILNFLA